LQIGAGDVGSRLSLVQYGPLWAQKFILRVHFGPKILLVGPLWS
jgi:hypothetical protein